MGKKDETCSQTFWVWVRAETQAECLEKFCSRFSSIKKKKTVMDNKDNNSNHLAWGEGGHIKFSGASLIAQLVKNLPAMQETRV